MSTSLYKKLEKYFPVGAAVRVRDLNDFTLQHFNRLTCEDAMKLKSLRPRIEVWDFEEADAIAEFAYKHNLKMCGHTFIEKVGTPEWILKCSPTELKDILKEHIDVVIKRYDYVVDHWEVANEMISDISNKMFLTPQEGSLWNQVFEDPFELILWVYKCAQSTLTTIHSSAGIYYNDYSLPLADKRKKALQLIRILRSSGINLAGVGFQCHWTLNWPDLGLAQAAVDELLSEGLKIRINEFEVSIYTKDDWVAKVWEPEKAFTSDLEELQVSRFVESLEFFKRNKIESLTFWGVTDETSWLNRNPIIRKNNPLLFSNYKPKKAFDVL